ncbi:hypothetical protein SAMN05661091_6069 [Paenibacillus uliginis N3/975]|uniref:Uncharacterized protein n=2 Tax=Paenibacillus TaxID=44249 RepID=A0A1X7HUW1_9BACL|nr:hypothetical protein SAMN05661091_6069 [Paenibacillus uliginis N3/975]
MERYSPGTAMDIVHMAAKLGDLMDEHYRNTLALSTIIELLIDKGLLTREEVEHKAEELNQFMSHPSYPSV